VRQKFFECLNKTTDVAVIQCCIKLIKHTEWRGLDLEDSKEQAHSCHCAFATGKQCNRLWTLAGRTRYDVNASLQRIIFAFKQDKFGLTSIEEFCEHLLEVGVGLFESLLKKLAGFFVDVVDHLKNLSF